MDQGAERQTVLETEKQNTNITSPARPFGRPSSTSMYLFRNFLSTGKWIESCLIQNFNKKITQKKDNKLSYGLSNLQGMIEYSFSKGFIPLQGKILYALFRAFNFTYYPKLMTLDERLKTTYHTPEEKIKSLICTTENRKKKYLLS